MPGRVGVDVERFLGVVGPVEQQLGTEIERPPVLPARLYG
jgi:hypothetical protein